MKKLLLAFIIAALPCAATFAQTAEIKLSPEKEKQSVEMSRELANELMLNEPEFIKLKALTREKLAKEDAARAELQQTPHKFNARLAELEAEFENKLLEFLTPSQKKAFAAQKQYENAEMIVITTEE